MKKAGLEFKVGIFVFLSLAILVGLVLRAGDFYMKPGYTLRLVFTSVSGIDVGSPVKLAGVNVGEVKDIHVMRSTAGETQAEVMALINQGVYIEEDAKVNVNSLGFLGEKYIDIQPGKSVTKTLSNGGVLAGQGQMGMQEIGESGSRLIHSMQTAVDHVTDVVGDAEFKASVKGTFTNADKVAKNLVETSDDLKDAAKSAKIVLARMRDGEGSIGRLLKDDKIAKDLEAFVEDIKAHPWKLLKRG